MDNFYFLVWAYRNSSDFGPSFGTRQTGHTATCRNPSCCCNPSLNVLRRLERVTKLASDREETMTEIKKNLFAAASTYDGRRLVED